MSSRVLVGQRAGAERPPPWRLMPLWSDSSPPTRTRVSMRGPSTPVDVEHDLSVIQQQRIAGGARPAADLVGDADRLHACRPCGSSATSSVNALALHEQHLAVREAARCGSSGPAGRQQHADQLVGLRAASRTISSAPRAVCDGRRARSSPAPRRRPARIICVSTFGSSVAGPSVATIFVRRSCADAADPQPRARCSSMATAGSVLPSRNSRKAPPPVEM